MEENNVEVMETEVITGIDDVKEDSTKVKVVGTVAVLGGLYGVGRAGYDLYKAARYKVLPKIKAKVAGRKSKKNAPEQEVPEEKTETKSEAKGSKKDNSKK